MHFAWFSSNSLRVFKFVRIKEGVSNFWGGTNFAECLNYLIPSSIFQCYKFSRPKFLVIYWIWMYSAWFRSIFLRVLKFLEIKVGGPDLWGERILQNVWIIWSPLLYFNLKSSTDPPPSSFIRFHSFLHESAVLFSESWKFYKLKSRDLIPGGNQFCRMSELFGPAFCISISKVF